MSEREQGLLAGDLQVQGLQLLPSQDAGERTRENHDPERAPSDSRIRLVSKAVADLQLELVGPHDESALLRGLSEGADDGVFVVAGPCDGDSRLVRGGG